MVPVQVRNRDVRPPSIVSRSEWFWSRQYTSPGCGIVPGGGKYFSTRSRKQTTGAPIAFHVDYFNAPLKDVSQTSNAARRQMVYSQLYTEVKNPQVRSTLLPTDVDDRRRAVRERARPAAAGRRSDEP